MPNEFVLRGSNATLQFVPVPNVRAGELAERILGPDEYNIADVVGRVTGVEVCIHTDLETFHEIGRRHAVSLHPGNINIFGRIDRAYINGALLRLLMGDAAEPNRTGATADLEVQPFFNIVIDLNNNLNPGSGTEVTVEGVRFENWSFVVPEDDFVMENVTFKALFISREEREPSAS
ncbi:MAG: hypothetical protein P8186_14440 [Anaerolineae bacterium]|jgi:hypothetical protein